MKYIDKFKKTIESLKNEGKYRIFNTILRNCGKFPNTIWYSEYGVKKVINWCSNDYLDFQGLLRWTLIVAFMLTKAGLIMAIFMHLYWERWAIVNVLLWPMTLIGVFITIMVSESHYTFFTRLFYFVVGS